MIQSNIVVRQKRGIILFYGEGEFTSLVMSEKTKTPQERGFCLRERLFCGEDYCCRCLRKAGISRSSSLKTIGSGAGAFTVGRSSSGTFDW